MTPRVVVVGGVAEDVLIRVPRLPSEDHPPTGDGASRRPVEKA
jgi:hypothetical protein